MTRVCDCCAEHPRKRIVLTGGPGAGKTAVLELAQQFFCKHLVMVPEAASLLFRGGFPRGQNIAQQAATQRAIFHVQRELETTTDAADHAAATLCDRGTIDGAAYWPGPNTLWDELGLSHERELLRYDTVVHLRVPGTHGYSNHTNAMRTETAEQAALIDERIAEAWQGHPRRFTVDSTLSFLDKAHRAIDILEAELPPCCRRK
jgi:predicted ATPase